MDAKDSKIENRKPRNSRSPLPRQRRGGRERLSLFFRHNNLFPTPKSFLKIHLGTTSINYCDGWLVCFFISFMYVFYVFILYWAIKGLGVHYLMETVGLVVTLRGMRLILKGGDCLWGT